MAKENLNFLGIFRVLCQSSAPWVAPKAVMDSRENSRGQPHHCLSLLTPIWCFLDVWGCSNEGGEALIVVHPIPALAQETFFVGPISLVTNKWWHWLEAGGLCDKANGDSGWLDWMNIHHKALCHPISFIPAVPCPLIETERENGAVKKKWWWESGRWRKWSRLKERRGLCFERCTDQMRETTWEGGWWERVRGSEEERTTGAGERIALER